jgi:hypothetical protein
VHDSSCSVPASTAPGLVYSARRCKRRVPAVQTTSSAHDAFCKRRVPGLASTPEGFTGLLDSVDGLLGKNGRFERAAQKNACGKLADNEPLPPELG